MMLGLSLLLATPAKNAPTTVGWPENPELVFENPELVPLPAPAVPPDGFATPEAGSLATPVNPGVVPPIVFGIELDEVNEEDGEDGEDGEEGEEEN